MVRALHAPAALDHCAVAGRYAGVDRYEAVDRNVVAENRIFRDARVFPLSWVLRWNQVERVPGVRFVQASLDGRLELLLRWLKASRGFVRAHVALHSVRSLRVLLLCEMFDQPSPDGHLLLKFDLRRGHRCPNPLGESDVPAAQLHP